MLLYANTDFNYCTFANNTSGAGQGGGLYIDQFSSVTFDNSIVSGNKGLGIYAKTGGVIQDSDVLFNANQGGDVSLNGYVLFRSVHSRIYQSDGGRSSICGRPDPLGNYYLDQQT